MCVLMPAILAQPIPTPTPTATPSSISSSTTSIRVTTEATSTATPSASPTTSSSLQPSVNVTTSASPASHSPSAPSTSTTASTSTGRVIDSCPSVVYDYAVFAIDTSSTIDDASFSTALDVTSRLAHDLLSVSPDMRYVLCGVVCTCHEWCMLSCLADYLWTCCDVV